MQILIITGSYPPERCGVGDYTRMLAMALAELPDMRVSVLTTGDSPRAADERGVIVFRVIPDWSLRRIGLLIRQLRLIRPDVVHVQYPTQGYRGRLPWLIPLIALCCGARVVQTWHEGFDRDLGKFLAMALTPGRVLVVREAFLRQFGGRFGFIAGLRRLHYINSASTLPKAVVSPEQMVVVRDRYGIGTRRLIVFFGFIFPEKGVEALFEIADPATDYILIVGGSNGQTEYMGSIEALSRADRWRGSSHIVGFAEPEEAARIMQAAEAIVLPLKTGGGVWNTSILAGILQGTFVLTTSLLNLGYDAETNVYYAGVDDIDDMKRALATYAGRRRSATGREDPFSWPSIASRHAAVYRSMLRGSPQPDLARDEKWRE